VAALRFVGQSLGAGVGRALPYATEAGARGPGLLLRAKLPAAVRGMGECGLHFLFFQQTELNGSF